MTDSTCAPTGSNQRSIPGPLSTLASRSNWASPYTQALPRLGACGLALLAVACSGSDDDEVSNAFVVTSTRHAAANATTPLLADGDLLAYLLSEGAQGNADLNGDMDSVDAIATRVNTATGAREVLNVAAESLAFARQTLFMVVEETADSDDWNGDMDMTDRVLLYVTPGVATPVFFDELAPGADIVAIGGTVMYATAGAPGGAMETNLRATTVATTGAAPDPAMVILMNAMDTDPGMNGVSYTIVGSDGDIVFATADETVEGGDLNGDTGSDATDTAIFAVIDAGAQTPEAISTELALAATSTPTAVPVAGGGEWLIAFLVDEADQNANLNDPALFSSSWRPPACPMGGDGDEDDAVLHWFQLTDLAMNTGAVNTGLVGSETGIAYALESQYVGVVTPESDPVGALTSGAGCDLNGDLDDTDNVFRWVDASNPAASPEPVTTVGRLLAIDTSVPGGSGGVVRLSNLFVLNVDEADDGRNWDGDATTARRLIAAHDPSTSFAWNFGHGVDAPVPVGVTWMREDPESSSRFFAAFSEEVNSLSNPSNPVSLNSSADSDLLDSVPTVPTVFSGDRLTFPGVGTATSRANSGITAEENVGYHRVSEADEGGLDLNGNGSTTDVVLQRFSLLNTFPRTFMATSSTAMTDVVSFGGGDARFGVFVTEEFEAGGDLNSDGDNLDFVVRYFRLP